MDDEYILKDKDELTMNGKQLKEFKKKVLDDFALWLTNRNIVFAVYLEGDKTPTELNDGFETILKKHLANK